MKRRPLAPVREEAAPAARRRARRDWPLYAVVVLAALVCYANSLGGDFVHDDIPAIVTNGDVTGANALAQLLLDDFWGTPMSDVNSHKSYRPLTTLTFRCLECKRQCAHLTDNSTDLYPFILFGESISRSGSVAANGTRADRKERLGVPSAGLRGWSRGGRGIQGGSAATCITLGIEGRYAGALYSAASQMKQLDAAEEHLVKFLEELNTKQRMKDFVESVDISRAAKAEALKYVGEKTGMPSSASNFLALVAENGRLKQLRKMIGLFLSVMVAHRSEVPCEVVTAKALDADTKKALLDALAQHVQGKKIMLVERVNPDIIGGMIVAIDDKVVDMSVSRKMQMYINLLKQLNHALWGASPRWWHACNAALHAACCALVARACLTVARLQRPFAALAAVLFAAHPVHTEAVSGVVGRADVLACFFFLSSMLVYHGSGGASAGRHCVWGSVLLAALSMLAKETGVTVLLLNLAFDLYRSWPSFRKTQSGIRWNKKNSRLLVRASKLLVSLVLLLSVRLALLQGSLPTFSQQDNPAAFHPSLLVRFMTFCYLAAFNWWLLLCPWTLSHDWQMGSVPLVASLADSRNLLTCAALGALLLLAYRCFTDLEAQRHAPAVLGLLLLVVPFVPAANVFVTVGFVVAERVLYIPSVGSVLITAYGAQLMWRARAPRRLVLLGVGVLVVSSALRTQQRNRDWRTKDTLLRADLATLPHNAKLHYNYANFLRDSENQENAIHHYKEALRLWPSYASAHNNLGTLIVGTGKAEYHFLQAIKYSRDHVNAHFNLGKLYRKNNKTADAARLLERCVVLAPRFSQAYVELLLMRPQRERGPLLRQVLALEPRNSEHHVMYGKWLRVHGLRAPAMKHFLQAMRISFQAKDSERGSKPDLLALRAAVLEMRELGQKSRILQLLTRWHTWRRGWQSAAASHVYLREWRLRLELTRRARAYARLQHAPPAAVTKTCLDHKQLDISSPEFSKDSQFRQDPHAETEHLEQVASLHTNHNTTQNTTTSEDLESREDLKTKGGCSEGDCRPERRFGGKKRALSVPASYKPTHNESEDGHKRSCSTLHKKDRGKLKKPKATISPFITDHLMQTF